jgi:hypothetical protein
MEQGLRYSRLDSETVLLCDLRLDQFLEQFELSEPIEEEIVDKVPSEIRERK